MLLATLSLAIVGLSAPCNGASVVEAGATGPLFLVRWVAGVLGICVCVCVLIIYRRDRRPEEVMVSLCAAAYAQLQ